MDIKDIYAGRINVSNLDPVTDVEDAITCLVVQFVMRNKFTHHIDVLDEVTPADWRAQVQIAAVKLTERLQEMMNDIESELHNADFKRDASLRFPR